MHIYYSDESCKEFAALVVGVSPSVKLLPCSEIIDEPLYLCFESDGLVIYSANFKPFHLNHFYNEFISKRRHSISRENLLQAANYSKLKQGSNLNVLDMTGGLGRDSILFALAGFNVTIIEQNPYLAIVLNYLCLTFADALSNMQIYNQDSSEFIRNSKDTYCCIYFDPMFEDNKSALSKKDMQIIDEFVNLFPNNHKVDYHEIYTNAIEHCHKLIVKRDNKQDLFISQPKPTYQKIGKTIRFDVYQGKIMMAELCKISA